MDIKLDENTQKIFSLLKPYGKLYIVGGFIRNYILGLEDNTDIDLATNIDSQVLLELLKDYSPTILSSKYCVISFKIGDKKYEIARLREDIGVLDGRNPVSINFVEDIEKDLIRRDFTINALAYDTKNIIDFHNSLEDIKNRTIRSIRKPLERFNEDKVRILRAFRFMAKLNFDFDEDLEKTILEMAKNKNLFYKISNERLIIEFNKIILGPYADKALLKMFELDILKFFIKEFNNRTFDKKIFSMICENYKNLIEKYKKIDIEMAYACLFCFSAKKKMTLEKFYESDSIVIFEEFSKKFKLKNNEFYLIKNLIYYHTLIFKNPSFIMLKRMLHDLINNKNVCKLLNLMTIVHSIDYDDIRKILYNIQRLYLIDEPVFLSDIDLVNSDLYNLGLNSKEFIEYKKYAFKLIQNGDVSNSKYYILKKLLKNKRININLKYEESAGAIVYRKHNGNYEFLIIKAKEGSYGFPKGHIENIEYEWETAIREVKEETNIDIELIDKNKFKHKASYIITPDILKEVTIFLAKAKSNDIKISEIEIDECNWLSYKEANKKLSFAYQRDLLKKAMLYIY